MPEELRQFGHKPKTKAVIQTTNLWIVVDMLVYAKAFTPTSSSSSLENLNWIELNHEFSRT